MKTQSLASPQSLPEFSRMFPNDDACAEYLIDLRWPHGFDCPDCGEETDDYWWDDKHYYIECPSCRHRVFLTAGTIMHGSHTDLLTWFYGAFLVTTLTPGISAVQFQKQLGLKRYETAFQILHKLRDAMVNPDREPLKGKIEVDETYIGGRSEPVHGGRSTEDKTLVVGAVEVIKALDRPRGVRAGRVRMRVITEASGSELVKFVKEHVRKGARVYTDGWAGYNGLEKAGFRHTATIQGAQADAEESGRFMPMIHLEFSNLKTWIKGTHHSRIERQHLQTYLNEFCFRHNRRFWRFSAFQTLLRLGMNKETLEYETLYNADEYGKNVHFSGSDEEFDAADPE
jgi:transposase-like protein/DNA-directed RNA polymerase subunit RPC12/RpoP